MKDLEYKIKQKNPGFLPMNRKDHKNIIYEP